jgi:2C-methyl-D-erythritol 2,4-cyclodiphosphate synthase
MPSLQHGSQEQQEARQSLVHSLEITSSGIKVKSTLSQSLGFMREIRYGISPSMRAVFSPCVIPLNSSVVMA